MSKRGRQRPAGASQEESLSDAVARCERVVRYLALTIQHAILSRTMVDAADADKQLLRALNETEEAQAFRVVRFSLGRSLLMQTMCCWDSTGDDRASLLHLADLLRRQDLANALAERAASRAPTIDADPVRQMADLRTRIRKHLYGERKKRLRRVREFRNHYIAHSLISPLEDRPAYADIYALLDEAVPLVETACLIVFGRDLALAGCYRINAEYARKFWASVRAGQIVARGRRLMRWYRRPAWPSDSE